jgi:putative ABC transport system permease protein
MTFFTFIIKNVLRRPVRSILTGIGVALAVGVVVALVGISDSFVSSFLQLYQRRKVDLIVVQAGKTDRLLSILDQQAVTPRLKSLPGVQIVSPALMEIVELPGTGLISIPVQGWTADSFMFKEFKLISGRFFQPSDEGRRVVMLGAQLAETIGKKTGDTLEVEKDNYFQVIGVYESFNIYENSYVIMLLDSLQKLMDLRGQVTGFQIIMDEVPDKEQAVEKLRRQIADLTDEQGRSLRLTSETPYNYVESLLQIRMARGMAWLTSAASLIIGTIGMLNTMITSVFERTREIGILRAIGWRKSRVMRMILCESLLLCAVGAAIGAVGAIALTRWLSTFPAVAGYIKGTVSMTVIAEGFGIAILVGLIGGIYPAYRGASLSPTEAIRHE